MASVASRCEQDVPIWSGSGALTILSFNVQYMAGKGYVFYYDQGRGKDKKPTAASVHLTLDRVAELIADANPDIVMLQEVNDADDSRSHYIDQLVELQQRLGQAAYPCLAEAYYWKAGFIPHPMIMGPVSMKLVTLSRFAISDGYRYQLPLMDNDPITRHFYFQRAILEVRLKSQAGLPELALLNTHFDAWGAGSSLMQRQVESALAVIDRLDKAGVPWVFAGDFNLLPPDGGIQWQRLQEQYDYDSALKPFYHRYQAVPSIADLTGQQAVQWYTHFPNDPAVKSPDRTIDYLFYSHQLRLKQATVRQHDTLDISDHLPLSAEFELLH